MKAAAVGLLALLCGIPALPISAQDCGTRCHECGIGGYEGRGYSEEGDYDMDCKPFAPGCTVCPEVERVGEGAASSSAELSALLRDASTETIADLAGAYRDRLLVSRQRGLVAIRGSSCDPNAVVGVVFLAQAKLARLQAIGVHQIGM